LKSYVGAIGVLDTNAKANDSVFVVPANDDSID
jgi:ribosomal protein S2